MDLPIHFHTHRHRGHTPACTILAAAAAGVVAVDLRDGIALSGNTSQATLGTVVGGAAAHRARHRPRHHRDPARSATTGMPCAPLYAAVETGYDRRRRRSSYLHEDASEGSFINSLKAQRVRIGAWRSL